MANGSEIYADLVIDASGRRSKTPVGLQVFCLDLVRLPNLFNADAGVVAKSWMGISMQACCCTSRVGVNASSKMLAV